MELLLILAVFVFLLIRHGIVFLINIGFVWLAAAAFNPPITSNVVWFIAVVLAYVASYIDDEGRVL